MIPQGPHFGHGGPRMERHMAPQGGFHGHHGHHGHHFRGGDRPGRNEFSTRYDFDKGYPADEPRTKIEE